VDSDDSEEIPVSESQQIYLNLTSEQSEPERRQLETLKANSIFSSHLLQMNLEGSYHRVLSKHQEMGLELLRSYRKSINNEIRKMSPISNFRLIKSTVEELPILTTSKIKAVVSIASLGNQGKLTRRRSNNEGNVLYVGND
jgi:hypothetical protein